MKNNNRNTTGKKLLNEVVYPMMFIQRVAEKAGIDISMYNPDELSKGFKVEQEHRDVTHGDPVETLLIAIKHLQEKPDYYSRLENCVEAPLTEKSTSKSQQRLMGMVHAYQQGKLDTSKLDNPGQIKKMAKSISDKDTKDFASTKHAGLPETVDETNLLPAGKHKLIITKSVDNVDGNKAKLVAEFIQFCCKQLAINHPCTVYLTGKRGGPITTTASYNPNNHEIWIYVKNRNMLADPLRSLAHELRHYKQGLDGVLIPTSGDDGSEHENEAHTFSGLMIRLFGKMHPEIFQ